MSVDHAPLLMISDPDQDRYARLRLWNGYRQEVIAQAKIMAGALGNEVLKNLALLGAGHLFIVDFDAIEASNLTRSVLFRMADQTRPKAEVAAERIQGLNPDVKAIPFHGNVIHDVGLGVFREMDVVIGCLDNRGARMAVNRACWRVGVPWVDGALSLADGSVRVFIPPNGACYECLMTQQDYALANLRYQCPRATITEGVEITTPMSASIIGAMQVQEVVKLLHKHPVQGGQGVYYSAETMRLTHVAYPRRANCPAHQPLDLDSVVSLSHSVRTLTVGDLIEQVSAHLAGKAFLVLPEKVITYLHCPDCGQTEKVYRPYWQVVPEQVPCPNAGCGTERIHDVTNALTASESTQDIPLTQLGVPAYAILEMRTAAERAYFELSGDKQHVLAEWRT
jgi:molybdopterin/thiamine biosynthesis adenylyltransferase